METSPYNWSKIPKIRTILISSISKPSSQTSVIPQILDLIQKSKSSPNIQKDVLNLILALKMTSFLNLEQKTNPEIEQSIKLLSEVENKMLETLDVSENTQTLIQNDFGKKSVI